MHTFLLILCAVVVVVGCAYLYAAIPGRRWKTQEYRPEAPIRAEVVSAESGERASLTARAEMFGRRRELCAVPDIDPATVIASIYRDVPPVWSDDEIRRARDLMRAGLTPDGHTSVETRYDRLDAAGWIPGTGGTGLPAEVTPSDADDSDPLPEYNLYGIDPLTDPIALHGGEPAWLFSTSAYRLVNEGHSGDTGSWRWDDLRALVGTSAGGVS